MDLTIALISYNTRELLLACLRSIEETSADVAYEVIVVDNASSDGSAAAVSDAYPQVRVIANRGNVGYAAACNQTAGSARGRYLLLLNSDTVMKPGTLRSMVDCMDAQPDVGALSCLQRDEQGRAVQSCFPFPSIRDHIVHAEVLPRVIRGLAGAAPVMDATQSQDVDWANGACLMLRKEVFERVGGMDERFFMYFEDVDLCRRIHQFGYRVRHVADVEIVHLLGKSSERTRGQLNVQWELSRIRYVEKHFAQPWRLLMKGWIAGGVFRKLILILCFRAADRRQELRTMIATLRRVWIGYDDVHRTAVWPAGQRG
ncbi:MAG: glycosyltransferase family 2 protein [Nitrospira sp.]